MLHTFWDRAQIYIPLSMKKLSWKWRDWLGDTRNRLSKDVAGIMKRLKKHGFAGKEKRICSYTWRDYSPFGETDCRCDKKAHRTSKYCEEHLREEQDRKRYIAEQNKLIAIYKAEAALISFMALNAELLHQYCEDIDSECLRRMDVLLKDVIAAKDKLK